MTILSEYSIDWQHLVVLLYALDHMTGGIPTKSCTIEYIEREGLLQLRPGDHQPYRTCREPSWQTDIAWARKNAVMIGYVNNNEWNSWEIARTGRDFLRTIVNRCSQQELMVSRCCLWSLPLKRRLVPGFSPSPADAVAPPKGDRSMPSLAYYQNLIEEKLQSATIDEIALRISQTLGMTIPATKPSVAFALHLFVTNYVKDSMAKLLE